MNINEHVKIVGIMYNMYTAESTYINFLYLGHAGPGFSVITLVHIMCS